MTKSLPSLLAEIEPIRITGDPEVMIGQLCYDSRQVTTGSLFFALPGVAADGYDFIADAISNGASGIILERERKLPDTVVGVIVEDARMAMGLMAKAFYDNPSEGMTLIGITGTNGKTTVSYLVESVLRQRGLRPAVFGTVAYRFEDQRLEAAHTTPESVDLYRMLQQFRNAGCNAVVMEVSSHALEQHRVAGLEFTVAVLTNLTPEHLDYHRDMDHYFAAKRRLFSGQVQAVVNVDDPYGIRLARELDGAMTVSLLQAASLRAADVVLSTAGISATLQSAGTTAQLASPLLGEFNLQNLLCAAGTGLALGLTLNDIASALNGAEQVPGRLESVANPFGCQILVDYAHTGDALEKALLALKNLKPARLLTLFGCGGDRDRTKRPVMGAVAASYAGLVFVTSDNPRTEDPHCILEEIKPGLTDSGAIELSYEQVAQGANSGFVIIADRRQAIGLAVKVLRAGDLLLVAGKGHEDYQIIGRQKIHFDDREELLRAIKMRGQTA